MSIEYIHPVFINTEVKTASWVEEISDREAKIKAVIYNHYNTLSAEASGTFVLMSGKLAAKMNLLSKESIAAFKDFLKTI